MKEQERLSETKLEVLNKKVQMQLREIAQLSKLQKRTERMTESAKIEKHNNNSSSSDSPNTN